MDGAAASDNRGEVTIEEVSETIAGDCAGSYTIARTFTATDDAGNSTSATQTITVEDTTAPEFTSVPVDYTAECSDELIWDDASRLTTAAVSIEVPSETWRVTLQATTRLFARSQRRTTAATARLPLRPSRFKTQRLLNPPFQRTTRPSAPTSGCSPTLLRLTTAAK